MNSEFDEEEEEEEEEEGEEVGRKRERTPTQIERRHPLFPAGRKKKKEKQGGRANLAPHRRVRGFLARWEKAAHSLGRLLPDDASTSLGCRAKKCPRGQPFKPPGFLQHRSHPDQQREPDGSWDISA
ncbi:unnamed protein product [Pleuronectes platessa]|uniref:Uncharacterized protein n=1 Tax=Pleuronectes platessa TaxID=8262 RepID=A0A9N7U195_PLEPL|nr:unnamed protein product [Pleuronectes platessa]